MLKFPAQMQPVGSINVRIGERQEKGPEAPKPEYFVRGEPATREQYLWTIKHRKDFEPVATPQPSPPAPAELKAGDLVMCYFATHAKFLPMYFVHKAGDRIRAERTEMSGSMLFSNWRLPTEAELAAHQQKEGDGNPYTEAMSKEISPRIGSSEESEEGDEWIEWKGGECPIPAGMQFYVRLRGGGHLCPEYLPWKKNEGAIVSADAWAHQDGEYNIIAYRLAKGA
jgi:hypothetical protein